MKSTRELEARCQGWGVRWVRKHPRHAKMVRLVEYRYLIIITRAGWHMIKFKSMLKSAPEHAIFM